MLRFAVFSAIPKTICFNESAKNAVFDSGFERAPQYARQKNA